VSDFEYEELYETTVPSVVSVYRDPDRRGVASGFVYDDDHVLTNEHVVRDGRTRTPGVVPTERPVPRYDRRRRDPSGTAVGVQ
jgi:S1-C subfamily serine protease